MKQITTISEFNNLIVALKTTSDFDESYSWLLTYGYVYLNDVKYTLSKQILSYATIGEENFFA